MTSARHVVVTDQHCVLMDIATSCSSCWKSFSCTIPGLAPRLLNCGHNLCTDCLGKPVVSYCSFLIINILNSVLLTQVTCCYETLPKG